MKGRRDPDKTREDLLQAGFEEIRRNGFRAADVKRILADAGVTKGALYHHFGSKKGLGYAVVDEVIRDFIYERWISRLESSDDPVTTLAEIIDDLRSYAEEELALGCPLQNLALEMSPVDEGFRRRTMRLFEQWRHVLARSFARGQGAGTVRSDVDPEATAAFLVAAFEGTVGIAKNAQSPDLFATCGCGILSYLETLRPAKATA